jgi:sugar phosphate isomerase/epimerase
LFRNLNVGAFGLGGLPYRRIIYPSECLPFEDVIVAARLGGFQGVDLDIQEISRILESTSVDEVKSLLWENRLQIGGWGLPVDLYGNANVFRRDLQCLPDYVKVGAKIGCKRVFAWLHPYSDTLSFKENLKFHVRRLKPIAEILRGSGCVLGLEFAGTETLRVGRKHEFIYTLDGALGLCEEVGFDNVGLLLDSWHFFMSGGELDRLRELDGDQIVYVQVNDAPLGVRFEEHRNFVRCLPGETGVFDLAGFLQALKAIGYDGPVTPEPFSSSPLMSVSLLLSTFFADDSHLKRGVEQLLLSHLWPYASWICEVAPSFIFRGLYFLEKLREKLVGAPVIEASRLAGRFLTNVWNDAELS